VSFDPGGVSRRVGVHALGAFDDGVDDLGGLGAGGGAAQILFALFGESGISSGVGNRVDMGDLRGSDCFWAG